MSTLSMINVVASASIHCAAAEHPLYFISVLPRSFFKFEGKHDDLSDMNDPLIIIIIIIMMTLIKLVNVKLNVVIIMWNVYLKLLYMMYVHLVHVIMTRTFMVYYFILKLDIIL